MGCQKLFARISGSSAPEMMTTAFEGRIGALVSAAHTGLGVLGRALYQHGVIDRVLVEPIRRHAIHLDWYANAPMTSTIEFEEFINNIDALLIIETVSDWSIASLARQRGIPITIMPMYEWSPSPLPVAADRYLCPSLLDLDYYRDKGPARFLPVAVDVPWRRRKRAKVFVHNAGNAESAERNGFPELLAAIAYVQSDARFLFRMQKSPTNTFSQRAFNKSFGVLLEDTIKNPKVEFIHETVDYKKLWEAGDVFVFPEKFNGLSLPLQEAHASGMLVMAGDRYPVNSWLPRSPLIPIHGYETRQVNVQVNSAVYQPEAIARHIDHWFDADIEAFSEIGRDWAESNTWDSMRESFRKYILVGD